MATQPQQVRSLDFLPPVFQTDTNKQFLASTLDVLISQPKFNRVEGFIGQHYGYAIEPTDKYVVEPTQVREDYQLSPALVFLKTNTQTARDFIDYPSIIAALKNQGSATDDPNKLFGGEFYSWDSFVDLDKIVNYTQYYWLPLGPDAVTVTTTLSTDVLDISTIIGESTYTAPNGVTLINGLKIKFDCLTLPSSFSGQTYYVEGVGTSIELIAESEMLVVEGGEVIYEPWSNAPWDTTGWSANLYVPVTPDYILINRNSRDRNAWSRTNRWFSQNVIDATIKYNGVVTSNTGNKMTRASRPIIEFYGNLSLWNSGTISAGFADYLDIATLDPLNTIAGQPTCVLNNTGPTVQPGSKVIFSVATDLVVRQQIYTVSQVPAGPLGSMVIALTPTPGVSVIDGSQAYVVAGTSEKTAQRWDAATATWKESQLKATVNQEPLFDIYDNTGASIGSYSSFVGTKLFSYQRGTGANDAVLGFPISYSSVSNLGDINFTVNLNLDKFSYAGTTTEKNISVGFVHYYPEFNVIQKRNGWVKAAGETAQYQVFTFPITISNQSEVQCDVLVSDTSPWASTQVYLNGNFQNSDLYTVTKNATNNTTTIEMITTPIVGDEIVVLLISDQVSKNAYYTVPANLQNNPFNTNVTTLAVGDIRNHYKTIFTNAPGITGQEFGQNNYENLGSLTKYGTAIIQNSASLVLPSVFLRKPGYSLVDALKYNGDEYIDFKNTMIDIAYKEDYGVYQTPAQILDSIIYKITSSKSQDESFFWSDMIVSGSPYKVTNYNFGADTTFAICTLSQVYDYTSANYTGIAVYLKRTTNKRATYTQLIRGVDYTVSTSAPSLRVDYTLLAGDQITVNEYRQTYGSYCPNTPTKLGLYKATVPTVVTDNTYQTPTTFIVGHDGSYTRLYGDYLPIDTNDVTAGYYLNDFRDIVLLEFERRVYNNIKVSGAIPLTYEDVFPGEFRTTGYTRAQLLPTYSEGFLNWVGKNKVDYRTQKYNSSNQFTFNYNKASDKLTGTVLQQGYWRGIYRWFYDTTNPAGAPWEMLGYTEQPTWWTARYGAAPYTSGNTLLWQDLTDGYDWNNGAPYINAKYVRADLLKVLPVDSAGNMVTPMISVVGNYDSASFSRSWVAGDEAPTESSYLRSSTWPFDLMKMLSVFAPAKFYNLFADRDQYKYDVELQQFVFNGSGHLIPSDIAIYGSGTSKNSYINWVVDYINQWGTDGATSVTTTLDNLDVRLTYRVAGFSDKQYLKFLIERSTPTSNTPRLLIPDDSYQILLYDDVPTDRITYSSVIVQKTVRGYTVWGNSLNNPHFDITVPSAGPMEKITVGTVTVDVSTTYIAGSNAIVAYGTEFYSLQGVSEFLRNYGRKLTDQGVKFDNIKDGVTVDWTRMIQEFVNWGQQGWEVGSTISLNPNATTFNVARDGLVVQPLTLQQQNFVLNQNLLPIQTPDMSIVRNNSEFTINVLSTGDSVAYTNLNLSSIEHAIVFDNITIFNDVIYQLPTGLRQNRIVMSGSKTADWNGYVNAQGFILNEDDIQDWTINGKYPKGQIVIYKTSYWSANTLVEPSDEFDYTKWTKVNYDQVKQGLLPNPSTAAYEATKFYDMYTPNLERDQDLLAYGLIGFTPRQYMADAELSDISQVNIYANMLKLKGTNLIANSFKGATLRQGQIDYDVRENWAIKNGDFGSVLNSNFVEFIMKQSDLTGNPALIGFSAGSDTVSGVQQNVNIADLINYGRAPSSANFLPVYANNYTDERGLPTAGYVNLNDVKFATYTLEDMNLQADSATQLYTTDIVWVANYRGSWAVFTPTSLGTTVSKITNNLNGTINVTFAGQHGLIKDDPFVIVGFDTAIDGYFQVSTVVNLNTITIKNNISKSTMTLTGTGNAMKLVSRRIAQASDATTTPGTQFATRLQWVDSDTNGDWQVLAAGPVYTPSADYSASTLGTSVAYTATLGTLATDATGLLYHYGISTGITVGQHIVANSNYVYGSNGTQINIYSYDSNRPLETPPRLAWLPTQAPVPLPNTGAITISNDRQWLYVANSVAKTVSVYMLSGSTYSLASTLSGPAAGWGTSIATNIDGSKLVVGSPNETVFLQTNAGTAYIYSRASESISADGTATTFTVTQTTGGNAQVLVNGITITTGITVVGTTITFTTAPSAGSTITVNYGALTLQQTLVSTAPHSGALFGQSVATNRYGAEVMIGVPYEYNQSTNVEGAVYRFTDAGQRYGSVSATVSLTVDVVGTIFIDGYIINYDTTVNTGIMINGVLMPLPRTVGGIVYADNKRNRIADQINAQEPTNVIADYGNTSSLTITTSAGTSVSTDDIIDIVGATAADLTKLGINSYTNTQIIYSPDNGTNTAFGYTIAMNTEMSQRDSMIVAATTASALARTTFDFTDDLNNDNDTKFDNGTTSFIDSFTETGAVYQFDYLKSSSETLTNPGRYIFGQYCNQTDIAGTQAQPLYGTALAFNDNNIVIGTPTWYANGNGRVTGFITTTQVSSWYTDKQPLTQVDVNRLSTIGIYDTVSNTDLDYLDYIDPVQGKMLSAVETNLDSIGQVDPASYDAGLVWGIAQVGSTWLDTTNLRMLNYSQPDISYNASNWGKAFPGSTADIYTWVASTVKPVNYSGSGYVVNFDKYTSGQVLNRASNSIVTEYYYWVKNYSAVPTGKTLSPTTVSQYILDPVASGVAFLAGITTNVVALFNSGMNIQSNHTALHLGYSVGTNGDHGHQDWSLIQDGNADNFLAGVPSSIAGTPTGMYLKYLNSFMGADLLGNAVPDTTLPVLVRYGVDFRPRQSMFVDRSNAVQNYIDYANAILSQTPITETRGMFFLNQTGTLPLALTATYDTTQYWSKVDWWAAGYSASTKVVIEVETYTDLLTIGQHQLYTGNEGLFLSLEAGLIARVASNGHGNSETYVWNPATSWVRIGLSNGTIKLLPTLYTQTDPIPSGEIYYIIRWLTEQVYTNDLAIHNNASLMLMFNLIQAQSLQQNNYLPWLNKTSLVDITHLVRPLSPYKKYQRDNQELVRGYLNEIKPFHVYIKEFGLKYTKMDIVNAAVTDFDLPAKYDTDQGQFISPRLAYKNAAGVGQYLPTDAVWTEQEYTNWFNNYGLSVSNDEASLIEVTQLVAANTYTTLVSDITAASSFLTLASTTLVPSSGTLLVNNETIPYTVVNYYTNMVTLGTRVNPVAHSATAPIVILRPSLSSNDTVIHLQNSAGLPDAGVISIDSELIVYTVNDKVNGILSGLTRGSDGTVPAVHAVGSAVSVSTTPVMVMNQGRGYTSAPTITATIDTTIYPAPRTVATFTAIVSDGKVTGVTVTNAGSGYAVMPTITVSPSPIIATWAATDVDTVMNQIGIVGHPFVDGDPVIDSVTGQYYYVGVLSPNLIALYRTARDADLGWTNSFRHDGTRVSLSATGGTISVTARVEVYTYSRPVREMKVTLKYDRTSYDYDVADQNAIYRIQNDYKPSSTMPGYDLNKYDQLMVGTNKPNSMLEDPSYPYGITYSFATLGVNTISNTIQVTTNALVVGDIMPMLYIASPITTIGAATFGLISNTAYWFRVMSIIGAATEIAAYATETAANAGGLPTDQRIPLIAGTAGILVSGQYDFATTPLTPSYDSLSAYNMGDYVLFNGLTYQALIAVPVTQSPTNGTYWVAVSAPLTNAGGVYSKGNAPEEMIPVVISGTVNMTVTSKPGSTWTPLLNVMKVTPYSAPIEPIAHTGFNVKRFTATPVAGVIDFSAIVPNPTSLALYADGQLFSVAAVSGTQRHLPDTYYTVDWLAQTITLNTGPLIVNGDLLTSSIDVVLYEFGNGNQLVRSNSTIIPMRAIGGVTEIFLDTPYKDITIPSAANFWLTAQVYANGQKLQYNDPANPEIALSAVHYSIVPQRTLDAANDPYNPAKIVFDGLYSDAVDYLSFAITSDYDTGLAEPIISGISIPETQYIASQSGTGVTFPLTGFLGDTNLVMPGEDNIIVEINGQRVEGPAANPISWIAVADVLSYPAPVYNIGTFDPVNLTVKVGGIAVATSPTTWVANYDTLLNLPGQFDSDFNLQWGYFDDGTPFDDRNTIDAVFEPAYLASIVGQTIEIEYNASGQSDRLFTVTPNANSIGGTMTLNTPVVATDIISVTTFNRCTSLQQSLITQSLQDITVSTITAATVGTPAIITTLNAHNLSDGDQVTINGLAIPELDGGSDYFVQVISSTTVALYQDSGLTMPVTLVNPMIAGQSSYLQLIAYGSSLYNPLLIAQPNYTISDINRLWVTVERSATYNNREYINPSNMIVRNNTLVILQEIVNTDIIVITSMIPTASPDETRFRLTLNDTAGITPTVYRENQFTRSYLSASTTTTTTFNSADVISVYDGTKFPVSDGTVMIQSEQIRYTTRTGNTLTGLFRGVNGTIVNAVLNQYSEIVSVNPSDEMSSIDYNHNWYTDMTTEMPLQFNSSTEADFLNLLVK